MLNLQEYYAINEALRHFTSLRPSVQIVFEQMVLYLIKLDFLRIKLYICDNITYITYYLTKHFTAALVPVLRKSVAKKTVPKPPHPNSVLKLHVATINSLTENCKQSTKNIFSLM